MKSVLKLSLLFCAVVFAVVSVSPAFAAAGDTGAGDQIVQAQAILTVAESKRLIGKGVARSPMVKKALKDGMVIIIRGSTNAYVAEEITGQKIPHAGFVTGRVEPVKGAKKLPPVKILNHITLVNGKSVDMPLGDAVKKLKAGDVVIKGANAIDYNRKLAAINIGDPAGGTTGTSYPYAVARKANLIIAAGLEKVIAGDIIDLTQKMREPIESLNKVQSMFLVTGHLFTEIEAIKTLTGATAFQCTAGGISGAEGAVWLVIRGTRDQVSAALKLVESIQGEPPYSEI